VQNVDAQWAILGTGEPKYEDLFETLGERFPQKVAARMEFSNEMAHRIEAGADMFLMPSRYEPCGLNQLYSLKYGTVPVVRSTGGLADTIDETNGFSFHEYSPLALGDALSRACKAYRDKSVWNGLIETGMQQDWSWAHSAKEYVELYQTTLARTGQVVSA